MDCKRDQSGSALYNQEPQDYRSYERDMKDFSPSSDLSYGLHDECISRKDTEIVEERCSADESKSQGIVPLKKNPFSEPWEESDLVLLVANEKFHVHRLVLILNSPVFKAMLKSDFTQARSKEITLPEKDPVEVLDLLLQLYPQQGEDITMENVGHILKLADEYQINSVIERCGSFLRITKKGNADAMYILVLAQKYKLSAVAEECCELLADLSLEDLEAYEEFKEVDGYHLRQVLLPRMRRLEKVITDLQPEISGLLKCATWLWSQAKKPMQWCPVHYAGGIPTVSQKDGLPKCKACENVIQHLATNTFRGSHYNQNEHPTANFVPVIKELFSLSGSKNN